MSNGGTRGPVVVQRNQVLTPSAKDWLREHRVEVVYPQGKNGGKYVIAADPHGSNHTSDSERRECGGARRNSLSTGDKDINQGGPPGMEHSVGEKPEHMTHLKGNVLVFKDHPRIAFRGYIDLLEAEITLAQQAAAGYKALVEELEEVLGFVRRMIRFDVLDERVGEVKLCGYTSDQLREYSHYPEKHFGQPHFMVRYTDGPAILAVNKVRTVVRQTELAAYQAFRDADGNVTRGDIILGLNRLSSLCWIFMIKLKAGKYEYNL